MRRDNQNFYFIIGLILIASFSRLIPHYPNFTPICAIALFGSKYFKNRFIAFGIPLLSLFISDVIINNFFLNSYFNDFVFFYQGFYWQYGSFILVAILGRVVLKKLSILKLFGISIVSSMIFFIISNFGVWLTSVFYPKNILGLISCYSAAVPFYYGTLFGSLFYSTFLFGSYEYLLNKKAYKVLIR